MSNPFGKPPALARVGRDAKGGGRPHKEIVQRTNRFSCQDPGLMLSTHAHSDPVHSGPSGSQEMLFLGRILRFFQCKRVPRIRRTNKEIPHCSCLNTLGTS